MLALAWALTMGVLTVAEGLENGLARTPPMGFLSWERFECNTDCTSDPDQCIGERMLMLQADAMVSEGYRDVGYEYITVDDCWPAEERDSEGRLQADPRRFPHGMKALAKYIHSKGLKLGIYEDVGRHTCAGFPGTQDTYEKDAQTFADWEIDMLKFDGCNTDEQHYEYGYPAMGRFLNATGRPILYSCEWAIYARAKGYKPDYPRIAETCNTFRVYGDIYDGHQNDMSVINWYGDNEGNFSQASGPGHFADGDMNDMSVINWYGDNEGNFSQASGPGHFADGDMVTIGNFGLSPDAERIQMGMWAMLASPILLSVDLRRVAARSKALLQNRRVLGISQDPLGVTARRVINDQDGTMSVWTKPILPAGSFAVAVLNNYNYGYPRVYSFNLTQVGLTSPTGYNFTEVFDGTFIGNYNATQNFTCTTNPPGIFLLRATPLKPRKILDDGKERKIPDDGKERKIPDDGKERKIPDDGKERNIPNDGKERKIPEGSENGVFVGEGEKLSKKGWRKNEWIVRMDQNEP